MTRLLALLVAFLAGAAAMFVLVHRLFGGEGWPQVEVDDLATSWGDV